MIWKELPDEGEITLVKADTFAHIGAKVPDHRESAPPPIQSFDALRKLSFLLFRKNGGRARCVTTEQRSKIVDLNSGRMRLAEQEPSSLGVGTSLSMGREVFADPANEFQADPYMDRGPGDSPFIVRQTGLSPGWLTRYFDAVHL